MLLTVCSYHVRMSIKPKWSVLYICQESATMVGKGCFLVMDVFYELPCLVDDPFSGFERK